MPEIQRCMDRIWYDKHVMIVRSSKIEKLMTIMMIIIVVMMIIMIILIEASSWLEISLLW